MVKIKLFTDWVAYSLYRIKTTMSLESAHNDKEHENLTCVRVVCVSLKGLSVICCCPQFTQAATVKC